MSSQEAIAVKEYAARELILRKVEETVRARGYDYWVGFVEQINYEDCSFDDEVDVEIIVVNSEPAIVGLLISAMQQDAGTEEKRAIWLRPEDKAMPATLDGQLYLCEYEPYAMQEAEVVKNRSFSYWRERAGSDGPLEWKTKFGDKELLVTLTIPSNAMGDSETRRLRMVVDDVVASPTCTRAVEMTLRVS